MMSLSTTTIISKRRIITTIILISVALALIVGYTLLLPLNNYVRLNYESCPMLFSTTTISATGFTNQIQRYGGRPPVNEFVLAPNTTGYITLSYNTTGYGPLLERIKVVNPNATIASFFNDSTAIISRINRTGQFGPISANQSGIRISETNVSSLGDYLAAVTYMLQANSSAEGTYLISFWQICPGEIFTVGNTPYQGAMPGNLSQS